MGLITHPRMGLIIIVPCISGHIFHVTNIYGPAATADKPGFINWLYNFDTSGIEDWLLLGDFNLIHAPEKEAVEMLMKCFFSKT
jgi:hypothetical protein